jgi:RNase H-fold protein (predicted Holliday junction resolvase)
VEFLIHEGDVRAQLLSLIREMQPDLLVLGWPMRGEGRPRFKPDEFRAFVAELERVGNTQIEVTPPPPAG